MCGVENVSKILSANGTWSIDENGKLVVKKIETEELTVRHPDVTKTGITIYDAVTGEPVCVRSRSKVLDVADGICNTNTTDK